MSRAIKPAAAALPLLAATICVIAIAGGTPKSVKIDKLKNLYGPVEFDHAGHAGNADSCKTCHHKPFGKPMACAECHDEPVAKKDFSHEKHMSYDDCASCHQVKSTAEMACSTCHKIPYDSKNLAVLGLKGALHAQCMGCHRENGIDNSCATCHTH